LWIERSWNKLDEQLVEPQKDLDASSVWAQFK
jgi:hypothetical protein